MAWRCQIEPYLKTLQNVSVKHCSAGSYKLKNKKIDCFKVLLTETIFFPEGGGQPGDSGKISWGDDSCSVVYTVREGENAVHLCDKQIPEGAEVSLEIDWDSRFDKMSQHSGQHLISAIFEQQEFNASTVSWNLGDDKSFIELSRPVSDEEVQRVENMCNEAIRKRTRVSVEVLTSKEDLRKGCKDLPKDFAGPIRVVNIDGIDQNMCCGTHVENLSDLQAIKLLHQEKKKGKGIVWFVCGQRVLKTLADSWNVSREACKKMSCKEEEIPERIENLQISNRGALKATKNLACELGSTLAEALQTKLKIEKPDSTVLPDCKRESEQLKNSLRDISLNGKVIKLHRPDLGPEFLAPFADNLVQLVEKEGKIIFLSCGLQNVGNIYVLGDEEIIKAKGKQVLEIMDGKGFVKSGRIQGKVNQLKNLHKSYELFE